MHSTGRVSGGSHYHQRIYMGLLVFVVVAGVPMVGLPSLRHRLEARVETLQSAAQGKPVAQAALAKVGENRAPFPQEYERPQWERPAVLPKFEYTPRQSFHVTAGGESKSGEEVVAPVLRKAEPKSDQANAGAAAATGEVAAKSGPEYKKGKPEQDAYDILVNSNPTLAGMIKGSDPTLKFQDWSAAAMDLGSYNVSVSFLQTSDNVVRKYIFNVKIETKAIMPLSAYAREISK